MNDDTMYELVFARGQAGAEELQATVDQVVHELAVEDSDAARRAREAGLEPADLADVRVTVREDKQGMDPLLTAVVIAIAGRLAEKAAESFWDAVVAPRIRRGHGGDALGPQNDDAGA